MAVTLDQARAAQRKLASMLKRVPQLRGIGIARNENGFALKVNLATELEPGRIPAEVDSVPVVVAVVGDIGPL